MLDTRHKTLDMRGREKWGTRKSEWGMNFRHFNFRILTSAFRTIVILSFCHIVTFSSAQTSIIATLTPDSTHILIGDHLNVRLAVKHPKSLKLALPAVKDSVGNMELVAVSKIDTITQLTDVIFTQNYVLSAFDSGLYHAGPVTVFFHNSGGNLDSVVSNEVLVTVSTLPVDTTHPFKPIKAPLAVPFSWREFIPYIIGGILLIILAIAGFFLWKKYRKPAPVVPARPIPKDPPHIWARKELKKLEEEKLWQKGDPKLYYSRLTDILRLYLEFRFGWLALESTTEEIEQDMKNYNLKEKAKENLLQILRTADLVKFAKMQPGPDVNIKALDSANKFIDFTEPREKEEEEKG
jgi:hypothetical protein